MVMTSVIYSHQERKFSVLEIWMKSHTSDLTSVKSDLQITGGDLKKKVAELQNSVFSLSSYLNMSGSNNPMTRDMQIKKLSNIETLMTGLGSSLSSLASKQENLQKLGEHWTAPAGCVMLTTYLGGYVKLTDGPEAFNVGNLLTSGCTESGWIPFTNSCYLFSHDTMNWTKAKDYCKEKGALLLKTEDASEREWEFVTSIAKAQEYWIGLTDQNTGQWRWVDDSPYTMNKAQWSPGQPDNWNQHGLGEEGEDCGHITKIGMDCSKEYSRMEVESEPKKSFWRGLPCKKQTGILVILGTVYMTVFMVMTFVIYSHQERNFSMLQSWMNSHTSDLTSVKSDFQITGGDLEKKVAELQTLVSSLSSHMNTSGPSSPMARDPDDRSWLSLNSLASKQEENLQKLERRQDASHTEVKSLMDSLSSAASELRDKLTTDSLMTSVFSTSRTQRILTVMLKSLSELKHSVEQIRSSIQTLSYKLSFTNLLTPGCTEPDWIPFRNSCYLFSDNTMNWTEAKDYCEEKCYLFSCDVISWTKANYYCVIIIKSRQGMLLLKIEDASEREFVSNKQTHTFFLKTLQSLFH
ncbi:C-type lectin domain family 4 member F [Labeo rohita]|uniref:C-type lectin domain family 4 member F n=1 Tax=Labeo rohita TaxID=84645 RepID=A0ABQ8MQD8_LABRO|nr:C-type lectin domain family 4 member F [Labeo rohita]